MESFDITIRTRSDTNKYPAKSHARRVAEKLGAQDGGLIALQGTTSAYFSHSDQKQPFRQDRYFYYLSGCNEPGCQLTYDIDSDTLTLYLPPVDYTRFFYDGRGSTTEEALEKYDIDEAIYIKSLVSMKKLYARSTIHTFGQEGQHHNGEVALSLQQALDLCRSVKDEHEIELIRTANNISAAAHRDVLLQLQTCKSEAEAEAIYMKRCVASLAKEQSYSPIFGAGSNAAFLHYVDNDADFKSSQLLLVDAGCEWQHYASDVTRTIPLNRRRPGYWPTEEAEKLYDAVEAIQEECISLMKPGTTFGAVNRKASELALKALLKLGVLKGDYDENLEAGTFRAFFPHGLGHHMGLEVHDVVPPPVSTFTGKIEAYQSQQRAQMQPSFDSTQSAVIVGEPAMVSGNVITVEPGIYFNKFFLDRFVLPVEKHRKYIDVDVLERYLAVGGVRIEDDILITKNGNENLTTALKGADMLKLLRDTARQ